MGQELKSVEAQAGTDLQNLLGAEYFAIEAPPPAP